MTFELGGRPVGGARCFVIAEAGVNHNGDVATAHRLIDAAADARADAVKFQIFDPDALVSRQAPTAEYQVKRTSVATQFELLEQLVLPRDTYRALHEHSADRRILFLASPFDPASADLLASLGAPAIKVASGEVTNHALLAHIARSGLPLLLSTGMSTLAEVEEAVRTVYAAGAVALALFHCVSSYPAVPGDCNLRAIETLRRTFDVPAGWSDHTVGVSISLAAVAMGAELLEKHLTLDRTLPGPDHQASLEPAEFAGLVAAIRDVEAARGSGVKAPASAELATRAVVRRSLHAARALPAGHTLSAGDLVALRPDGGVPASEFDRIVGRRLRVAVAERKMLKDGDIE